MANNLVVFACSNPEPEIKPELAHYVRDNLIMAAGCSDCSNQINNALCFSFILRCSLDARATENN